MSLEKLAGILFSMHFLGLLKKELRTPKRQKSAFPAFSKLPKDLRDLSKKGFRTSKNQKFDFSSFSKSSKALGYADFSCFEKSNLLNLYLHKLLFSIGP